VADADSPLVRSDGRERYFDYCLQPYAPRRVSAGALRSESLLWQSFLVAGAPAGVRRAVERIREACGRDLTVFGVKLQHGRLFWELYFYDPQKEDVRATATSVAAAVAADFTLAPLPDEGVPYFMFSFDLAVDTLEVGAVRGLNLYLAEPVGQAGRSYKLLPDGALELDNFYHFLRPKQDIAEVLARLRSSVFCDVSRVGLHRVLAPELFACNRVCVAKKRRSDAVYHSGLELWQFEWFLRRHEYPAALVDFVGEHREALGHLRYDVGMDYTADGEGRVIVHKTSFYGTV
jgi:hypothetical protein